MAEGKSSSVSNSSSTSRWNPTKEQISMLENLYKQGVRTPSAEQIQQITGKLREFGSIEGKNVFYWFQNHKARQRQKQKQHSFAYYTRLLQRSPQLLTPVAPLPQPYPALSCPVACNNGVILRPFYVPPQAGGLNFYPQAQAQYSAMFFPESSKMDPDSVFATPDISPSKCAPCNNGCWHNQSSSVSNPDLDAVRRETLQLFPLQPTNRIAEERSGSSLTLASPSEEDESSEKTEEGEGEVGGEHQFLFDFLGALNG